MNAMRKVLVVDDDPVVSKSFDRVLTRRGYVVVSAENGQEALNKIAKENYDAVFTDIKMPGMDGIAVAQQMRASRPWTPVVIITGYGSAENEARAEAAGVRGFLRKPLSPAMIESSLAAAMAAAPAAAATVAAGGVGTAAQAAAAVALVAPAPMANDEAAEPRSLGQVLKNITLFFAAPFIALAYIALFPLIGFVMLARTGVRAWHQRHPAAPGEAVTEAASAAANDAKPGGGVGRRVKDVALFLAAPFIALAYIALFPLIGFVMLARTALRAWRQRRALG